MKFQLRGAYVAGFVAALLTLVASHLRSTPYNNYVLFAQALEHGHLWIQWPGPYIDAVLYNGHRYIVNDPLPSLFLLPFVPFFGTATNQTLLAVVLCGVGVGAAWRLCERLGCDARTATWLCAFLFLGTDLLWVSMLGDVWFIAQTSCVCMTMLALCELAGKNRAWLTILLFVGAIASRFTVVMALPVILLLAFSGGLSEAPRWPLRGEAMRRGAQSAAVIVPLLVLWVFYNLARWGVPWDSGHTIFFHEDPIGGTFGSPFSLRNLPYQLWSFFAQLPQLRAQWPWVRPSFSGVALTWTSPALVLAFFARAPRLRIAALWAAVFLAAGPSLLYYVNGYAQYGMRHALDFEPFLFVLMIYAAREQLAVWAKALIAYSCAAGIYGVWYWNAFVRPGN